MEYSSYHDEVVQALREIGDPRYGEAVRRDRGSQLEHLGIQFPVLRKRVRHGFSFSTLAPGEVLAIWDGLWRTSPYGDVLFAALEYYSPIVRERAELDHWSVMKHWTERVDNWCHSDMLSNVYSFVLQQHPAEVYPQLQEWNTAKSEWQRRISIVSLMHYGGKNAVFLPAEMMLPLVTNCLHDHRYYLQLALGWVLREMSRAYPTLVVEYIEAYALALSPAAFTRAIARLDEDQQTRLKQLRRGKKGATR